MVEHIAVFGDSWAAMDCSWPVILGIASRLPILQFAVGGSTSDGLAMQVGVFQEVIQDRRLETRDPGRVLAVIHTGGNDLQHAVASDLCRFIGRQICNCCLWGPCQLFLATVIVVFTLLTQHWGTSLVMCIGIALCIAYVKMHSRRNERFVAESLSNNVCDSMEVLYTCGVRQFLVAGLPVSPAVPFLAQVAIQLPCPTRCLLGLIRCFSSFSNSRLFQGITKFKSSHEDCTVIFFDEARELNSLLSKKQPEPKPPSLAEFWMDPIHPSPGGHFWLAQRAQWHLMNAHYSQFDRIRGPNDKPLGLSSRIGHDTHVHEHDLEASY